MFGKDTTDLKANYSFLFMWRHFKKICLYILKRFLILFITVTIGVYLTILVANMGGAVDEIREGQIRESVSMAVARDPEFQELSSDERQGITAQRVELERERLGLDRPFIVRSFMYLRTALTLDLGRAETLRSDSGSARVRNIMLERLLPTLVLFGLADIILFTVAVVAALFLSRRYGSKLDRAVVALAPTSAAPSWFYGIFLMLIFASFLGFLPFGGMVESPPPDTHLQYFLSLARHIILPLSAIILSAVFLAIYSWRTFFLIYSREDYVEMAKAKGLPSFSIDLRYILRPTLPTIVTNFALMLISMWMGAIVLETIFNWPGLGRLLFRAINQYDTPVIIGSVVVYAYLLALTVFLLDIVYSLLDPRIRVGEGTENA